ncbi:class I tRNA ligase family protein, partial [Staphylococcus aureus]|uniref:class I tRNA ligase family protein n=1 Tax=Staphylococcus aureus TaxID=1280 RepID=UPI0016431BDD
IIPPIKQFYPNLQISNHHFITTTQQPHKHLLHQLFQPLLNQPHIYLAQYQPSYSLPHQTYYTQSQLLHPQYQNPKIIPRKTPHSGHQLQLLKQQTYFFNISKYTHPLLH